MKKSSVIGLGSILMGDEGIGVYLVRALRKKQDIYPEFDFIDLGVAGFKVLHRIAGREKVIFVDCAFMGMEAGSLRRFIPEEVESLKTGPTVTNHAADLMNILDISGRMGDCPGNIIFFGIQPETVEQQQHLSATLRSRFDEYLIRIEEELKNA